jgi:transcriptional regulator with XRE-family HTH domain
MSSPDRQPKQTIRQLRQERGWTQVDLAVHLGVVPSVIANWERGRVPPPGHQQALANLFGVSVEAIAFGPVEQAPG